MRHTKRMCPYLSRKEKLELTESLREWRLTLSAPKAYNSFWISLSVERWEDKSKTNGQLKTLEKSLINAAKHSHGI